MVEDKSRDFFDKQLTQASTVIFYVLGDYVEKQTHVFVSMLETIMN